MQACGKKLTSFCCVWVDFALGMDQRFSECECNFKSLSFHVQIKSVIRNKNISGKRGTNSGSSLLVCVCAGCKFQVSTLTSCRVCPNPLSLVVIRMLHTTLSHADLWEKTDEFLLCLDGLRAGMDLARFTSPSWTDCMYKQSLLYKIRISQHSESSS